MKFKNTSNKFFVSMCRLLRTCPGLTAGLMFIYFTFFLASQNVSRAQDLAQDIPEISEKLGTKIDLNLKFTDESGQTKTIREMFNGKHALIITFNYFRCTTMCTYQLFNLTDALKKMNEWSPRSNSDATDERAYEVASLSFDPTDTVQRAQTTRQIWLKKLGVQNAPWHFYVSNNPQVAKTLAESLNFYFEKDDEGNYSHTAGLFFIDETGVLKRYLYGIVYEPRDIKYALIDTTQGKVGSVLDKILLKFSKYNAQRGKYQFYGS